MKPSELLTTEIVELIRRLEPTLVSIMRRKHCHHKDFSDLRQDIAVNIVEFVNRNSKLPTDGEVLQIAKRRIADYFRSRFKMPVVNGCTTMETTPQLEQIARQASRATKCTVRRLLKILRPQARSIIVRHYLRAESVVEIAGSLDMSIEGVYASLRRSRHIMARSA